MKKKILYVITSAMCALAIVAAFAVKSPVAKAEVEKGNYILNSFDDSFVANNCETPKYAETYTALKNDGTTVFKKYNGYNAKFNGIGSYVEYKKAVDVTDNTTNDVIFEFIPSVETQGTREFYKFNVYFIDEQDENKYIKLEIKANAQYYTYINASAKDGDKEFKPASKYQGVYASDADNDRGKGFQTGFGLSGYGGNQNFQSYRIYWDNAKKVMEVGASRESNNVVRDFSIPDGELGIEGYTGTEAFGGFTSGKVKIKVTVENNLLANQANITFVSIDGEKFARPFGMEEIGGDVITTGNEVLLPAVNNGWNVASGKEATITESDYTVSVTFGGETVAVENGKFKPQKGGEYTIVYKCTQDGIPYKVEQTVTVFEYSLPGAAIRVNTADGKNGIRFYARIEKKLYDELSGREGFASGTLVIPQSNLGDSSLDENTATVLNMATTEKWYQSGEYMVSVVYLYDIPAANYGKDICARGYITAGGKTYYTETGKWSMTYVAEYAYQNFKDKVTKDKIEEYFGTYTATYTTSDGTVISSEEVKYADTTKSLPTEYGGKKITSYKVVKDDGTEEAFTAETEILGNTTVIVVFAE